MMAADSQTTEPDGKKGSYKKIWKKHGVIIGIAGTYTDGVRFAESFPDLSELDDLDEDFEAMVLTPGGILTFDRSLHPTRTDSKVEAIGSGGKVALGAMLAGAPPDKAVRIAAKIDAYTGGRIRTYKLRSDK